MGKEFYQDSQDAFEVGQGADDLGARELHEQPPASVAPSQHM